MQQNELHFILNNLIRPERFIRLFFFPSLSYSQELTPLGEKLFFSSSFSIKILPLHHFLVSMLLET